MSLASVPHETTDGAWLARPQLRALLAEYGVAFVDERVCTDPHSATDMAAELGFPVAVKLESLRDLHKSDRGRVVLEVSSAEDLERVTAELTNGAPDDAELVIQPMVRGVELIVGISRDDVLGSAIVVGSGGIFAEVFDDVTLEPVPVSRAIALGMLDRLRSSALLYGARGRPPVSREAVADVIVALSELAMAHPEISELDLNPLIVSSERAVAVDARAAVAPKISGQSRWDVPGTTKGFFEATSIAVVGVSTRSAKLGNKIARYLDEHDFGGAVHLVSNTAGSVNGRVVHAGLDELMDPVALACIAVPAEAASDVIEACGRAGVERVIVHSSGFADGGEEGVVLQLELVRAAHEAGVALLGPNSLGVIRPSARMCATPGMGIDGQTIRPGGVALLSQSGAIASSLLSRALEAGLGFAAWVSTGNEAAIGVEAFIEDLVDDEQVQAFAVFVEGLRRPAQFLAAARAAAASGKPVVVFKAGSSEAGGRAVRSHTGNLAGASRHYNALFRRAGVVCVDSVEDLATTAHVLAGAPRLRGTRTAVVTMSGGAAAIVADLCADHGLETPPLSAALRDDIAACLPSFAVVANPLDVTMAGIDAPTSVTDVVRRVAHSGEYDMVLVQLTTNADPSADVIAEALIEIKLGAPIPVLIGRLGARTIAPKAVARYAEAGVPVATSPGQLVRHGAAFVQLFNHSRAEG
jgi:acyl-CoA synthetase (NDP forming)